MADLEWMRTFLAVYRAASVSRAAEVLHLTQPAVSQHLKALEAALSERLFVRLPRGVSPTPRGHARARTAAAHVDALGALLASGARTFESLAGTVHLGGPAELFATKVLAALAPACARG